MSPYPSKEEIAELTSHLSTDDFQPFYNRVAKDVTWDVLGSTDASGHFTTLDQWKKGALETAGNVLKSPLKFNLANVIGGGDQPWAAVELEALEAVGRDGEADLKYQTESFNVLMEVASTPYPQKYCWVMRFNEQGIIVQVRVYADTQLAQKIIAANT